ncbi:MAG: ABC transporter permease [Clostridium sp.]|uniref:ABC transporter permease n=1 Tax=Clostridium sp. TaxID=1506 RepID=UPI0039EA0502
MLKLESKKLENKKNKKKDIATNISKTLDYILMFLTPIVIVILWEIFSDKGFINPSILPSPIIIWDTLVQMAQSGELLKHLVVSLLRVLKGYAIGCILGISIGTLMGLIRKFERSIVLLIGLLRPIPVIAWVPMLILWLGIGEISKVTVIAIGTFWPVLLNTVHGIVSTNKKYLEVGEILEKNKTTVLLKIIFPSAMPSIFTGLRIGIGSAWMSVVGAELIAASSGIGYLISYARELSQPDVMIVGVISIGIIGLLIDTLIKIIQKRILRWNADI